MTPKITQEPGDASPSPLRLNLGCGENKKDGYVNVDFQAHVQPDVVHDLNKQPFPFDDDQFELIEAFHVLEHLDRPFQVMQELHRILKPGGVLHVRVPHFSRGMTHAEHKAGFDVTFPQYFNPNFTKSGYFGVSFDLAKMELHWMAFFHLLPFMGVSRPVIVCLRALNAVISCIANLSPSACSRLWCFWVGGFEEIEFQFRTLK